MARRIFFRSLSCTKRAIPVIADSSVASVKCGAAAGSDAPPPRPLSHSSSSPLATTGSGVPSFSSSRSLLPSSVRQPASARKRALATKLAVGDLKINLAFAEHCVRAELHQILAGDQGVHLRFIIGGASPLPRAVGIIAWCASTFYHPSSGCGISGSTTGCGSRSAAWTAIAFNTAWRPAKCSSGR